MINQTRTMVKFTFLLVSLFSFLIATGAQAHEVRPAYLEIRELEAGLYSVFWKVPLKGTMRLKLDPVLPEEFENASLPEIQVLSDALVTSWKIKSQSGGLEGEAISIAGLNATITDVLVRVEFLDGREQSTILRSSEPGFVVSEKETTADIAWSYLVLGVEHILGGIDHLLFVLALLLLVNNNWLLLKTITAFTIAHSITLASAVLGFVRVPSAPVEAVIALSILFLASELAKRQEGRSGLTERYPWVVAFMFGLLHGFGFAGALSTIGLPQHEIPLALFQFNVGVEIGQIMFVIFVLGLMWVLRRVRISWPVWARQAPNYAIGSVAAFWCIQRIVSFW